MQNWPRVFRDYRIRQKRSLYAVTLRWRKHLQPFFGGMKACGVNRECLDQYVDKRLAQKASNVSVNRELSALRRMRRIGLAAEKIATVPVFPHLDELNIRTGFLEDSQYPALAAECAQVGLWLRALFEFAYTYGWRRGELCNLRVKQCDLLERTIRLEPLTTKSKAGRTVKMSPGVYALLSACITGQEKEPDDYVFERKELRPVGDFRKIWARVCCAAGVGKMLCPGCHRPVGKDNKCSQCCREWKYRELKYRGLLLHDLRRTGARNLRRAGVPTHVIMEIGGWKTLACSSATTSWTRRTPQKR